ncbi:MAG: Holliday junction resolvase RuvX, partial [Oscillospiraceae bacterium]|nr:Holliday junction resolvase RuvX [Oscillospiraceae bacterium]
MAIDYGDARTGLAVSDATGTIAGEAWTLTERDRRRVVETVAREAAARGVSVLV